MPRWAVSYERLRDQRRRTAPRLGSAGARVALRYPGPVEQQVTVYLDAPGSPTFYLDVQGDLSLARLQDVLARCSDAV